MPTDPNLILNAALNFPQIAPNPSTLINNQLGADKLQLFNQQQQGVNALRDLYSNPENLVNGKPTPEAMQRLTAAAPQTGLDLQRQLMQDQQGQVQLSLARAKEGDAVLRQKMIIAEEAQSDYQENLKTMTPEQALAATQKNVWTPGRQQLAESGLVSPDVLATMPPNFDPQRVGRSLSAWNQAMLTPEQKEAQREHAVTEAQGEERLTIEQQNAATAQARAAREDKNAEKGQWAVLTDPGKTDDKGNQVQYRYNATTGEATTLDRKPYTPTGAAKMVAAGGPAPKQSEIDYWSNVLKNGGALPPGLARTKQGSDLVRQIMANIPDSGTDPGAFIANHAQAKANTSSLGNMTKMADAATSFERTARQNFDYALTLAPEGVPTNWGPWLNKWIENGETQAGMAGVPAYVTAMLTAANEYAKIMSGSTGSQGSTVDSRREAAELFSPYLSQGQIKAVVAVAEGDMDRRKQSLYGQVSDIRDRLAGGKAPGESAAASSSAPSPTQGNAAALPPKAASPTGDIHRDATKEQYDQFPSGTLYTMPGSNQTFVKQ